MHGLEHALIMVKGRDALIRGPLVEFLHIGRVPETFNWSLVNSHRLGERRGLLVGLEMRSHNALQSRDGDAPGEVDSVGDLCDVISDVVRGRAGISEIEVLVALGEPVLTLSKITPGPGILP